MNSGAGTSISLGHIHQKVGVYVLSHVRPFATLWTIACQAPPSMGLSLQEHWSGLPFPPPEDLPDPGAEPESPAKQSGFFLLSHVGSPRQLIGYLYRLFFTCFLFIPPNIIIIAVISIEGVLLLLLITKCSLTK